MANKWEWAAVHNSHKMRKAQSRILSPKGTPRMYGIRKCQQCKLEQAEHPAGKFMDDGLEKKCAKAKPQPKIAKEPIPYPKTANSTDDLWSILKNISFVKSCINFNWTWEVEELFWRSTLTNKPELKGWLVNTTFRRPDINTGKIGRGAGRKIYFMKGSSATSVFFSCVVCVKLIVEHEWMEAIRFNGKRVLNPHHTVEELSLPDILKESGIDAQAFAANLKSKQR